VVTEEYADVELLQSPPRHKSWAFLNSHCGQEDISKCYVHLIQKKLDNIECYEFVQKTCNMSDFSLYL